MFVEEQQFEWPGSGRLCLVFGVGQRKTTEFGAGEILKTIRPTWTMRP